jgi:hypothetical protein
MLIINQLIQIKCKYLRYINDWLNQENLNINLVEINVRIKYVFIIK